MLTLNYTYRIYPNQQQEAKLNEWLEICRGAYNYALRELKDWLASRKSPIDRCSLESEYIMSADYPFPDYYHQQNQLPKAKKVYPNLAKPPSQVVQCTLQRLQNGWEYFQKRGFGFPRFKKYGQLKSLLYPQFKENPLIGYHLKLPKIGEIPLNLHRAIPEGFIIKQVRVIKKALGWFAVVAISTDVDVPSIDKPFGHCIGVDVNLLAYVATSDGYTEKRPKFFVREQSKLKLLQRRLSRKQKRSSNYDLARKKLEKQHNHIAFTRKDHQFKLAHRLCDMADSIFVEDIDFRIMAKGMLGKHTLDASFGQFRQILKYVCQQRGKFFGEVDHKGTSQTCPNCRTPVKKELFDRIHDCPECGYHQERDVASAQEICNRGLETYIEKYSSTQGRWEKETACQVEVPGVSVYDTNLGNWRGARISYREVGSLLHNL